MGVGVGGEEIALLTFEAGSNMITLQCGNHSPRSLSIPRRPPCTPTLTRLHDPAAVSIAGVMHTRAQ